LFEVQGDAMLGVDATLLQEMGAPLALDQWRVAFPLGLTHQPEYYETRVGWEVMVAPGVAHFVSGDERLLGGTLGAELGLPIRLGQGRPPWRADRIVDASFYVVPTLGATALGFESYEAMATLGVRAHFWSTIVP
jgi:hypothetical protein